MLNFFWNILVTLSVITNEFSLSFPFLGAYYYHGEKLLIFVYLSFIVPSYQIILF